MKKLTEILKRHVWCVIIIAAIILVSVITLSFGEDVNFVSHWSLAAAIVSIVLAFLVFVYMVVQGWRSSQNITEMKNLIDRGTYLMIDKARILADKADSMKQLEKVLQSFQAGYKSTTPPLEIKESLQLDFGVFGHWGLMVLYSLAKSHESGKTMSWEKLSELIYEDGTLREAISNYGLGIIQSIASFLGGKASSVSSEQPEVENLPDGLRESVTIELEDRLNKLKEEKDEFYAIFKGQRDIIDEYFDNL